MTSESNQLSEEFNSSTDRVNRNENSIIEEINNFSSIEFNDNDYISSDFIKDIEIFNILLNDHFRCKKCKFPLLIEFQKDNINIIKYYCKCNINKFNSIENKDNKFINNNKLENIDDKSILYYGNEYTSYCDKCNKHLEKESSNLHKKHEYRLIKFDELNMNNKIRIIKDMLLNDEKTIQKFKKMNKNGSLKEIIEIIINNYKESPNIILIKNIKHIFDFFKIKIESISLLEECINNTKSNSFIENNNNEENNYEKTRLEDIRVISLKGGLNNKIYNELFCDELKNKLQNLIELTLFYNHINDIEPLLKVDLRKLEVLNLACNKLSDEMIPKIEKLELPKLRELYLSCNYFTKYDIFKKIQHFKKLEILHIGSNRFIYKGDKNNYKNVSLNTIKEMNLINGVFNDDSIDLLFLFELKQLEIINLFGNNLNLSSFKKFLSFISKSKWNNLKQLNLMNNNIIGDFIDDGIKTTMDLIQENMKYYDNNNELTIELKNNELKDGKIILPTVIITKYKYTIKN